MFENDIDLYDQHMFAIFDQNFCQKNSKITGDKYGFVRDLRKVWSSPVCKDFYNNNGIIFGSKNTLLLESDEESAYFCH